MKRYKTSYSNGMILSSIVFSLFLLLALYFIYSQLLELSVESASFVWRFLVMIFIIGTLIYAFIVQPQSLILLEDRMVLKRVLGELVIPYNEIIEVDRKKTLLYDVRLCGISGLFGHSGLFWNRDTGRYIALVKDGTSMIRIRTSKKTYVISCDNSDDVINELKGCIGI